MNKINNNNSFYTVYPSIDGSNSISKYEADKMHSVDISSIKNNISLNKESNSNSSFQKNYVFFFDNYFRYRAIRL